jgi:DNA-binding HxlR family transcriptional regulator
VRFLPKGKRKHTEASAAKGVEEVLRILEGRWKLVILFHLFGGHVRRFSELAGVRPTHSRNTDARYRSGVFGASDGLT